MRPRFRLTDADPRVVGFFFGQYVELMKHGKDKTDQAMKEYLFDVITQLGVPEAALPVELEPTSPEPGEDEYPIINRKRHGC